MSAEFSRPTVTAGMRLSFQNEALTWSSVRPVCRSAREVSEVANTQSTTHSALLIDPVLRRRVTPGHREQLKPSVAWTRRRRAQLRARLLAAAVILTLTAIPVALPVVPAADVHSTPIVALNYDAGETMGWPAYVRQRCTGHCPGTAPGGDHARQQ